MGEGTDRWGGKDDDARLFSRCAARGKGRGEGAHCKPPSGLQWSSVSCSVISTCGGPPLLPSSPLPAGIIADLMNRPPTLGELDNDNEDDNDKRSSTAPNLRLPVRRISPSVHREARGRTVRPAFSRRSARLPDVGAKTSEREASSRRPYTLYSRES